MDARLPGGLAGVCLWLPRRSRDDRWAHLADNTPYNLLDRLNDGTLIVSAHDHDVELDERFRQRVIEIDHSQTNPLASSTARCATDGRTRERTNALTLLVRTVPCRSSVRAGERL
jgi:hypothetical protein